MTTLWLDGFDNYGVDDVTSFTKGSYQVMDNIFAWSVNPNPRTGAYAAFFGSGGAGYLGKHINAGAEITIGVAMYPNETGLDGSGGIVVSNDDYISGNPIYGHANSGKGFRLYRTATNNVRLEQYELALAPTILYESTGNELTTDAYSYIELQLNATAGTWEIRLNGNTILASGAMVFLDTFNWVFLAKKYEALGAATNVWFDDLYIDTDTFLSSQRCYTQYVASDELPQDWTLSSGTDAWQLLNDATPNPANFIQGDNVGDISAFGINAVPVSNGIVNAIRISAVQNLVDAGSGNAQQTVTINGVPYVGTEKVLTTSEIWYNDTFNLVGVTLGHINALTMQVEKTA